MEKGSPISHYFAVTDLYFNLKYQGYKYYKAKHCSEQDFIANTQKCFKMKIF